MDRSSQSSSCRLTAAVQSNKRQSTAIPGRVTGQRTQHQQQQHHQQQTRGRLGRDWLRPAAPDDAPACHGRERASYCHAQPEGTSTFRFGAASTWPPLIGVVIASQAPCPRPGTSSRAAAAAPGQVSPLETAGNEPVHSPLPKPRSESSKSPNAVVSTSAN